MEKSRDFYIFQSVIAGNLICSSLSLIGTIIVLVCFLTIKNLRSLTFCLIFVISISEFLNSLVHLFSIDTIRTSDMDYRKTDMCNIQGFFILYTDTCTLIMLGIISNHIFRLIMRNDKGLIDKKINLMLIGPIIALIITLGIIIPFEIIRKEKIDNEKMPRSTFNTWCWIRFLDQKETISTKYKVIPLLLISIIYSIIVSYIVISITRVIFLVQKKRRKKENTTTFEHLRKICKKLYNYIFVGTIWWIFAIINFIFPFRIQQNAQYKMEELLNITERIKYILLSFYGMFTCIRGFFIFIVFYNNQKVKEEVNGFLKRIFPFLSKLSYSKKNKITKKNSKIKELYHSNTTNSLNTKNNEISEKTINNNQTFNIVEKSEQLDISLSQELSNEAVPPQNSIYN